MSKLRIKVSGCMRSMHGAETFCAIRSYLATATRYGIGWLDALTRAAQGHPWVPGTTECPGLELLRHHVRCFWSQERATPTTQTHTLPAGWPARTLAAHGRQGTAALRFTCIVLEGRSRW